MENKIRILSTKKLLVQQRQFLLNAGFSVIEADFVGIKHKDFELQNIGNCLVFTSSNAVKSVLLNPEFARLRNLPCFCVGEKTKALLEKNGFNVIASAPNASALSAMIVEHGNKTFTFFAGNLRLETLPTSLKKAGISYNEVEVYQSVLQPQTITATVDAILFFSPSGVESFISANPLGSQVCFCIGETTAKALEGKAAQIVVANKPTVENVIIQCIKYYDE